MPCRRNVPGVVFAMVQQYRGIWLAALALASCSQPYTEPFITPYDKLSGAGGTIWFVNALRQRSCSWFECGERSSKILGATLTAYLLRPDTKGALEFIKVAQLTCDEANTEACDIVRSNPQLRLDSGRLVLVNGAQPPGPATIAWSGMRDFELARDKWLCTAERLSTDSTAKVLKVSPNARLTGVGQVLFALPRAPLPGAQARCVSLAALPRSPGASRALYLGDAVRDGSGKLHIAYMAKDGPFAWRDTVPIFSSFDGVWHGRALDPKAFGEPPPPSVMPGFLDTSAQNAILDARSANGRNNGASVRLYVRSRNTMVTRWVSLPIN